MTEAERRLEKLRRRIDRQLVASQQEFANFMASRPQREAPQMEMYEGELMPVINPDRIGWWRFHDHYDRNGYCDNPGRGY